MLMPHALEGCLSTSDLYQLYQEQHRHPDQLQAGKAGKDNGEGVFQYLTAEIVWNDVTLRHRWVGKQLKICSGQHTCFRSRWKKVERLTKEGDSDEQQYADEERDEIEEEVPMIVDRDAIVYPWAVVIVLRYAATTSAAVLAPQRPPDHALHTIVLLVKFPQLE